MIDRLDDAIATPAAAPRTALDPRASQSLAEAISEARALSAQAKSGPTQTEMLTGQRNTIRIALSQVVGSIIDPITDSEIATQAQQLADMWAAQKTLFEQGLSVVELTAIMRRESTTPSDDEIGTFRGTLRAEAALLEAPAQRYPAGDPNITVIDAEIAHRTDLLNRSKNREPDLATLDDLKQSLFTSVTAYTGAVITTSTALRENISSRSAALRAAAWRDSALVAALLLGGVLVAVLVASSLLTPMRRLRAGALHIAHHELPAAIARIKIGDEPDTEIRRLDLRTDEELGQLARAVDDIHDQALRLAGEQAHMRLQTRSMFETLARRNKSLVDLQLELIEKLEFDEREPDRLEHLFRLDHLAARLRRNGENLLILAGHADRRGRTGPLALGDVVRAAISEVEHYERVRLQTAPGGALTGIPAIDLVHMLAEIIDNALRASPPQSTVTIDFTRTIEGGTTISVIDHGIGITRTDLEPLNARLTEPTDPTPDTTRHMGLFVVAQLATRHGITVHLRPTSDTARHAGITASLKIPSSLHVSVTEPDTPLQYFTRTKTPPAPFSPQVIGNDVPSATETFNFEAAMRRGPGPHTWHTPARGSDDIGHPLLSPPAQHLLSRHPIPSATPVLPADPDGTETTPIYLGMVSEWLTDPTTPAENNSSEWISTADLGWSAARHAAESSVTGVTEVGLPQRVPRARLVPGAIPSPAPSGKKSRNPDSIRANLDAHHRGIQAGRIALQTSKHAIPE